MQPIIAPAMTYGREVSQQLGDAIDALERALRWEFGDAYAFHIYTNNERLAARSATINERPHVKPAGGKQQALFGGLDCLPGQIDLFNTDYRD